MKIAASEMYAKTYRDNAVNLNKILTEHPDIKIRAFPRPVFREFSKSINARLDDLAEQDPLTKEIIQSQRNYINQVRRWTRISNQAYLNNVQ